METTNETVVLNYKSADSADPRAYWHGTVLGHEKKFVRVIVGVAIPQLDRQAGAAIVLGELYQSFKPMDLTGLAAAVGTWSKIKTTLLEWCRDLKPDHVVTDSRESRQILWQITGLENGLPKAPLITYEAPKLAATEVGRQNVESLIDEGRLHIEHLVPSFDQDRDQLDRALRYAVNWALEFKAFYPPPPRGPLTPRLIGTEGL